MPANTVVTVVVCLLAGLGAGFGTGFAGMSAAAVIAPMLISFLGFEPYLAVGIALASDVLAHTPTRKMATSTLKTVLL